MITQAQRQQAADALLQAEIKRQPIQQVSKTWPQMQIEDAYAGMKRAVDSGGDYVTFDLRFHQGLLQASGNRLLVQMSKVLGALLRTSFEISTAKKNGPAQSLSMHRDVLDAVIARQPDRAEAAILRLIDGAKQDIESVLSSRRRIPNIGRPASPLRAL